jgi:hypothetical protein
MNNNNNFSNSKKRINNVEIIKNHKIYTLKKIYLKLK